MGPQIQRFQGFAVIAGVVGAGLCGLGLAMGGPNGLFPSYLFAYFFWTGITLGSLALLMLHHTVGGGWGFIIRRFLETAASPVMIATMAVLFLPMLVSLFVPTLETLWANPKGWAGPAAEGNHHIEVKQPYLTTPWFLARLVAYFLIWGIFSNALTKLGATQYERTDREIANRLNYWGGWGILFLVLTVTFMSVDWVMSLTATWMSSIFGLLAVASMALSTLGLYLFLLPKLAPSQPVVEGVPSGYFRDLGNLTLATVLLWAYMSFSQYLIIFSGNTQEEVLWYVDRKVGGWGVISLSLVPLHFGLPFLVLLIGDRVKRNPRRLATIAGWIVFMRFVDLWWIVVPTFRPVLSLSLADLGAPLLIGAVWMWIWLQQLKDKPIVALYDPRLQEALAHPAAPGHEVAAHG